MTTDPTNIDEAPVRRRPGRPPTRTTVPREATPRKSARGEYLGRDGEVLKRTVVQQSDEFEIPGHLKEPGWDYQWLSEHIYNNPGIVRRHNHAMYQAGWRPVLAKGKWNGVFGPESDVGHIRVGDSGLYERPAQMSEDARNDDKRKAVAQMRDRDQSLMGKKANIRNGLSEGYEMGGKYRGTGGDIRMAIDPALDVPGPSYQAPDDSKP
jgi:hypothetical protein